MDPGDYEMSIALADTSLTVVARIRPDSLTQLVVGRSGETRQRSIGLWDLEEWIASQFLGDSLRDGEDLLPFDIPPERGGGMPPVYRHDARSDSTGGRVLLKLAIDTAGRMMGVHVVGSDPGLMKAAVLSAALWDYVPATLMGSYVPSHMYRYVRFDPPEEMAELERSTEWRTKFDTPPRLVHKVLPEYPDPALLAEFEGVVRAEIRIDATGKVVRVIPRDGPRAFHDSVIAAVLQWEFEPAIEGGVPVPVRVLMPVRFVLRD